MDQLLSDLKHVKKLESLNETLPQRENADLKDLKEYYPDYFPSDDASSTGKGLKQVEKEISLNLKEKQKEINDLKEFFKNKKSESDNDKNKEESSSAEAPVDKVDESESLQDMPSFF